MSSFTYSFSDIEVSHDSDECVAMVSGEVEYEIEPGWHGSWDEPPSSDTVEMVSVNSIDKISLEFGDLIISTVDKDYMNYIKEKVCYHFLDDQDTLLSDAAESYAAGEIEHYESNKDL
tara:strand:+ start:60 stop:413 length:354 start_codon:yes stop_codon:yes gene_type:complete